MSSPGSRIDRACDRFEAQWRAGPRPRIEDYLRAFPEPQRPELFHQLLKVELELRRDRGDEPTPDGYRRQFPQYREQIDAVAFGRTTSLPPREPHPRSAGPKATADDNPLDHGALAAETQALTPEHLEGHGDAPQRSPAAPSSLGPVRPDPGRSADPEPQAGLFGASAARGPEEGPEATRTHRAGSSTPAGSPGAAGASTAPGPRFRVLRPHARGGLGEVFVAHDEELHRDVALKVIQDRYAGEPGHRSRFLLEAEVTGRLEHPGVVPVYGLGTSADGRPSYAMRFIRGESLKDAIARFHRAEGPGRDPGERAVAFRELLGRFLAVCHAIAYAHDRGVLHRDLKPGNVMLGKYGETLVVDWGLAKLIGRPEGVAGAEEGALRPPSASGSAVTAAGEAIGTPAYMSPEQAAGQPDRLGPASDVYSLGATLYCLLTGRAPFESPKPAVDVRDVLRQVQEGAFPPPRATGRAIPAALEAICLKAMARMPEDRYASPQALASDLEHWLADEPVTAYPEPWGPRLARWVRRHRTWTQAGAVALLAVAVISVGAAVLVSEARNREWAARGREDRLRRLAETRVAALRAEGQDLILKGQEAFANQDWRGAKLRLSNARATLGSGPELAELKAHAERLLDETDRQLVAQEAQQKARDRYQEFLSRRDEALSRGTLLTVIGLPADREGTESACREALALYGVADEAQAAPTPGDRDLSERENAEITTGCYELLLLLAEAVAQPSPHQRPEDRRLRQALRILDRAGGLGSRNQAYHLRRAYYLAQLGDRPGEAGELRRAELRKPTGAADFFQLGHERVTRGDLPQALRDFDQALQLQPDHFWAQYLSAVCYLGLQRPDEAKTCLTAYLSRRPDFIWIYLLRGVAYGELDEFEAADADFRKALELAPDEYARYGIYVNRGAVGIRQGRLDAAVADLRHATALLPDQYQAYALLAQAYQRQQKTAEAVEQLDQAIRLEPTLALLYRARARLDQERHDSAAALQDLEQAIRLEAPGSPPLAEAYCARGSILYQDKRYQDAVGACDAALRILPDYSRAHLLRARSLLELEQYEAVVRSCDRYLKQGEPTADVFRTRGQARARLRDYAGAVDDYTRALGIAPAVDLHVYRGWSYGTCGAWELALRDFEEAVRLTPQDREVTAARGYARIRLGRYREAVEDAEEALRRQPKTKTPETLFNVACIFARAVNQAEADAQQPGRQGLMTRYGERALEALRQALDTLPDERRSAYWRDIMHPDADLDPIRHSPGFGQLDSEYRKD